MTIKWFSPTPSLLNRWEDVLCVFLFCVRLLHLSIIRLPSELWSLALPRLRAEGSQSSEVGHYINIQSYCVPNLPTSHSTRSHHAGALLTKHKNPTDTFKLKTWLYSRCLSKKKKICSWKFAILFMDRYLFLTVPLITLITLYHLPL